MTPENSKKIILLCGAGALSLQVLLCLKAAGFSVHGAGNKDASVRSSRNCTKFHHLPLPDKSADADEFIKGINELQELENFSFLVPGAAYDVVAEFKDLIKIPLFPVTSIHIQRMLDDKGAFRAVCEDCQVDTPESKVYADKGDIEKDNREFDRKMVVKPTNESFMQGVVFTASTEELYRKVLDNAAYVFKPLIVQQFIEGEDIDLSLLALEGEILKSAVQVRRNGQIIFLEDDEFASAAARIVKHLNYSGVAHFDARRSAVDGKLYFLECNPRFWGSINAALFCGINFVAEGLLAAQNKPVSNCTILPGEHL